MEYVPGGAVFLLAYDNDLSIGTVCFHQTIGIRNLFKWEELHRPGLIGPVSHSSACKQILTLLVSIVKRGVPQRPGLLQAYRPPFFFSFDSPLPSWSIMQLPLFLLPTVLRDLPEMAIRVVEEGSDLVAPLNRRRDKLGSAERSTS